MEEDFYLVSHSGMPFLVQHDDYGNIDIVDEETDSTMIFNCNLLPNGKNTDENTKAEIADKAELIFNSLVDYEVNSDWTTETILPDNSLIGRVNDNFAVVYLTPVFDDEPTDASQLDVFTVPLTDKANISAVDVIDSIPNHILNFEYNFLSDQIADGIAPFGYYQQADFI